MFKKLLSNLPFNPSLIGQVSFYAKRMKQESALRRAGVVFMCLALVVQLFATISPAKASLNGSTNDILDSGFESKAQAVDYCRNGKGAQKDFGAILDYYGISCDLLASSATTEVTIKTNDGNDYDSLGRNDQGQFNARTNKPTNQYPVSVPNAGNFYMKDLSSWDTGAYSPYKVLKVTNRYNKTIMILFDCGNIVTIGQFTPPAAPKDKPSIGWLDGVNCEVIGGWAFDQSKPTASIMVHIYIDGVLNFDLSNGLVANKNRPDIALPQNYPEAGPNHGFMVATPASIKDKKSHKVEVFAIGIDENGALTGVNPSLGAKTVTLDCSKPPVEPPKTPCPYNPSLNLGDPKCIPCPTNPSISQTSPECAPCENIKTPADVAKCIVKHKTAANDTQNLTDAQTQAAQPGDVITYTLTTKNISKDTIKQFLVKEDMNDVLDYALITDFHGGAIDQDNHVYWPLKDIKAGQTIMNRITIKVKSPLPQTNVPPSDKNRFDLVMTNVYGDTVNIKLPCVGAKCAEVVTTTLPNTGPGESLAVGFVITFLAAYFFARSRLFATELDIVRQDFVTSGGM